MTIYHKEVRISHVCVNV